MESYPYLESTGLIDELIPKKEPVIVAKWYEGVHVGLSTNDSTNINPFNY